MSKLKEDNPLLSLPENFVNFVKSTDFLMFLESIYIYCYVTFFCYNFINKYFTGISEIGKEEKIIRKGGRNWKVFIFFYGICIIPLHLVSINLQIPQMILPYELKRVVEKGKSIVNYLNYIIDEIFIIRVSFTPKF